jgi:hypothetical protein
MKIAFCFLLTYSFPMEKVWKRFFKDCENYFIIIHSKPSLVLQTKFFNKNSYIIDPIETKWGHISLVLAQNKMLNYAVNVLDADFCCILSGNCIPVKTFDYIYNNLDKYPISRLYISDVYHPVLKKKQSQWCVLSLEHIQIILKYEKEYINVFNNLNFRNVNVFGAPDEYFYITLLLRQNITNINTEGSTYCKWYLIHSGHPKEFDVISNKDIREMKTSHYFFARKILSKCKLLETNEEFVDVYSEKCELNQDIELIEIKKNDLKY